MYRLMRTQVSISMELVSEWVLDSTWTAKKNTSNKELNKDAFHKCSLNELAHFSNLELWAGLFFGDEYSFKLIRSIIKFYLHLNLLPR